MALPKLIVVLGTTACGKSGLGVELAKRFGGEIVSADSRQVYRGLDLGTGKVTEEEMEGVPHHMLDVVEPNQPYSVAEFQAGAYAAIDGILSRGNTPFLVGGTGLYVRAVTEGFTFTDARPDPALRAKLEGKTTAELYALLREKTGVTLTDGEEFNRQRLMRSVEKALSGQWESPPPRPRYDCLLLGVTFPRDVVCRRIDERLQAGRRLLFGGAGTGVPLYPLVPHGENPHLGRAEGRAGPGHQALCQAADGVVSEGSGRALAGHGGGLSHPGRPGSGGFSGVMVSPFIRKSLPNRNLLSMDSFAFHGILRGRYQAKESQPCGISNTRTNISTMSPI